MRLRRPGFHSVEKPHSNSAASVLSTFGVEYHKHNERKVHLSRCYLVSIYEKAEAKEASGSPLQLLLLLC